MINLLKNKILYTKIQFVPHREHNVPALQKPVG